MRSTARAVAVSPDGKSVYVASASTATPWRASTATRHRGDHPARRGRRLHQRDGAGPCADGHALYGPERRGGEPGREERLRRLVGRTPWRASTATRPPGRSPSPPGAAGCISETGAGPCADGHALDGPARGGGEPGRKERLRRLGRQQRRGALQPQHDHRGDHPARRDRRLHQRDGAGPCADGHGLDCATAVAVSPDGKSVYVASASSDAVARLNRNTTTGAITQPAGTAGCVSETGAGPCADGHGSTARLGGGERGREERLRRLRPTATPWRASTATRRPGRSPSPPGPPAASARPGRGRAPTAMGSTAPRRWR